MSRIGTAELEKLKTTVSLVRLVEAAGVALKKHGSRDLIGHCPFHNDKTPSLVVSPDKNLWHCLGACGVGGSVVDWVMRTQKVSFRHAVELLRADQPVAAEPTRAEKKRRTPALPQALVVDEDDRRLLQDVVRFYRDALKQSPECQAYLDKRGLLNPELIETFQLGFANRTLGYRLPRSDTTAGAEARGALQRLGVIRDTGHEHLNGSLVIPLFDAAGNVVQLYGRKIGSALRAGTATHLYLPGPQRGVFNLAGLEGQQEVILCEALIDALTFWAAGYRNVTASYGVNGFTAEHLAAFQQHRIKRVLIAYDNDAVGNQAAADLAKKLTKAGFDVFRLVFPKGMDANAYAVKVQPASKSLGLVIRRAEWLGNGKKPDIESACEVRDAGDVVATVNELESTLERITQTREKKQARQERKEVALQEKLAPETISPVAEKPSSLAAEPVASAAAETPLPAAAMPEPPAPDVEAQVNERDIVLTFGDRRYRVRGLSKNTSFEVLKLNILVARGDALHVDTFDLYSAKHRQSFARVAAAELNVEESALQRDLGKVLLKCEELQERLIEDTLKPKVPDEVTMPAGEREAALELLRDPNLAARLIDDIETTGLVGEPVNALVGYLAAVSRKLDKPLAIIIQSTSAAGKSALMDAVLDLVPEEDRIHYSAMTGQSLFYLGERDLKHKILAIAEEEGVRQASYALKLLQSQGELTIASTGKDPATGKLVTEEYRVEGPVMLLLTTTAIDIDEELLNRCLVLTINESREQTRRIQERQRKQRTLEGLLQTNEAKAVQTLHRNAQRLLRPLAVVNPFAEHLTFLDERTRTRRDHQKYLTLIDVVALLHQHQRDIQRVHHNGKVIEYVEVTLDDIALANHLAHDVLGRSLDELPPQTRQVLGVIARHVGERMQTENLTRSEVRFTRRDIRELSGLSNTQVSLHLDRLVAFEYLIAHHGRSGQRFVYELVFDGDVNTDQPRLLGLIDLESLTTTANLPGVNADLAGRFRSAIGAVPVGLRATKNAEKPRDERQLDAFARESTENALLEEKNSPRGQSRTLINKSLAAKAS